MVMRATSQVQVIAGNLSKTVGLRQPHTGTTYPVAVQHTAVSATLATLVNGVGRPDVLLVLA